MAFIGIVRHLMKIVSEGETKTHNIQSDSLKNILRQERSWAGAGDAMAWAQPSWGLPDR